ncbi:G protein-coupled glucose receptor regulating Gpa2-domain-containing protein [Pseudomassariella vexata]|uniref:G protein-coupled glucose receptor regulating Gpa2-domain-containing protein n=1 Tax=Pseudomassariella vexata TaxID=1141098 RepID=A0A1Y2E6X6_9PEZI|nr:G protein-coupled glucose receptor regulating Gpa2-domain-containing protein [Pseudomassariella vexata]ORY67036.1 G protein-coupled glucose receptor regulating Gpa2-domain-containing protein [Pseudomassariella vexata]
MIYNWSPAITIPTLVGSASSFIATGMVIVLWILSKEKSNLRYSLIMNLTFAEFINSLNNSVSGLYVAATQHTVPPGNACRANGWIGQVSVQAADFSILAIAFATLLTIDRRSLADPPTKTKYIICLCVWIIPLITGSVALGMDKMAPVSGNWCWISSDPRSLRYLLGHGWRFAIFMATTVIYVSIFRSLGEHLRARKQFSSKAHYSFYPGSLNSAIEASLRTTNKTMVKKPEAAKLVANGQEPLKDEKLWDISDEEDQGRSSDDEKEDIEMRPLRRKASGTSASKDAQSGTSLRPRVRVHHSSKLDQEMWQWFLMVLYPLTYILLWIPGIANRMAELTGHNYGWLTILQASTQFTGIVNAMIYGFREHRGTWSTWMRAQVDRHFVD